MTSVAECCPLILILGYYIPTLYSVETHAIVLVLFQYICWTASRNIFKVYTRKALILLFNVLILFFSYCARDRSIENLVSS